jgi:hypothetical protein
MDAAGLPALLDAIKHTYGLDAKWIESVPVRETHGGKVIWDGEVQVFEVTGHPKATRVYAWSHESGPNGRRRFHVVLGVLPVTNADMAVRAAILSEARKN